jgi:quercetin dioxygenase-like cupin family protein
VIPEQAMASIERPLTGGTLSYDLRAEAARLRDDDSYRRSGRLGRTLAKQGRFRQTLTVLAPGAAAETHHSDSPMSLHVLEGSLRVRLIDGERDLHQGEMIFTGPGDAHDIRATEESAVLITVSAQADDFRPAESR